MDEDAAIVSKEKTRMKAKVNNTASRKRCATFTVTLKDFVGAHLNATADLIINDETKEKEFASSIDSHFQASFKRAKMNDETVAQRSKYSLDFKRKMCNYIISEHLAWLESKNACCLFSKDALKLFLATYYKCIDTEDFQNTAAINTKSDKKDDSERPILSKGMILVEYVKGAVTFATKLAKTDSDDISALKDIVENQIQMSDTIYEPLHGPLRDFTSPIIAEDDCAVIRPEGYAHIPLSTNKLVYVLVTAHILMIFDGKQFVTPTSLSAEREFSESVHLPRTFQSRDYMVLQFIFANKSSKIVDVVKSNFDLPSKYMDRIKMIKLHFPNMKIAASQNIVDGSYLHKPLEGFDPGFMHFKHNLTTAAVGIIDKKNVLLTFLQDSKLVFGTRSFITGPSSALIYSMSSTTVTDSLPKKIMHGLEELEIVGDLKGVELFKHVILLEYKEGNTIGAKSMRPISSITEFKPPEKCDTTVEDMKKKINGQQLFFIQLCKEVAPTLSEESKAQAMHYINPDMSTSFGNYSHIS